MTDPKKKRTQKDVARLAGISQAIVSHVVNQTDKAIPAETRARVLRAKDELGYTPNKAARSLRTQKTFAIACLVPDITNPFFPAFLRGVQEVADRQGYDLIIYDAHELGEKEAHYLRALAGGHVDGAIVVLHHTNGALLPPLLDKGLHLVSLEPGRPEPFSVGHDTVYVDNILASKTAVTYLISLGHTRIGMLAGTEGTPPHHSRLEGYRSALADQDILFQNTLIRGGDYSEKSGYQEMVALLSAPVLPTAVFAANDLMAIGAIQAVQDGGLNVPGDIAILGFDDIPAARLVHPSLTTVTQFQENIGMCAAGLLFDRLRGKSPEGVQSVEMPFEIVIREST